MFSPEPRHASSSTQPLFETTRLSLNIPRQRSRCLAHLAEGKSSKEIANAMNLSSRTVDHYLGILRKEFGCRSSRELITSYNRQLTQ